VSLRIVGISSSPRHGNTDLLVKTALEAAGSAPVGVTTEFLSFVGKRIDPCSDCQVCATQRRRCIRKDDWQELVSRIVDPAPDGLIIGSPVYFFSVNAELRAFFERCTSLLKGLWVDDYPFPPPDFTRTAGGAIAVGYHRHGGAEHAMSNILEWMLTVGIVCTGADYIGGGAWQGHHNTLDAVAQDELGLRNARVVGRNVAYLAYLLKAGADADPKASSDMLAFRNGERAMT
jgi:multimeric flavodoxin WrbA